MVKRIRWSPEEIETLKARYPHERTQTVANDLGRSCFAVFRKAKTLGLSKTAEYMASADAYFVRRNPTPKGFNKGRPSPRKGMKGYRPSGAEKGHFKPGQIPINRLPIGSERIVKDGYIQKKVSDTGNKGDWVLLHRLIWEEHHGPIPPKHFVGFKDGNKQHCAIDNLELLDGAEIFARNSIHNLPPELKEVIFLNARIRKTIKDREGD